MQRIVLFLVVYAALAAACDPPDCDRKDLGSCGNACCVLAFPFDVSSTALRDALTESLLAGGCDGLYTLQTTAEDPSTRGFADLRPFHINVDFQGQTIHTTRVARYNDTINMSILPTSESTCILRAGSLSLIGGALGDHGQNYKNIICMVKAVGIPFGQEEVLWGCPVRH